MAIVFDAPVEPDEITGFIREVPVPSTLSLLALFPRKDVTDNKVDFSEIVKTNRTARFRSFDGRIHVSRRDTGSVKNVALPPLSTSLSMGEYERLQLEFARTGGTNQRALVNSIYNDAGNLTNEVNHRYEQAWGDLLGDGKLTINENGFMQEYDAGVPATHLITVGTAWTNPAAPALDNLIAAMDIYNDSNGYLPGGMILSRRMQRALQTNTQFINAIAGSAAGRTRVNQTEIGDLLNTEGLPGVQMVYDTQVDVDGTSTRVIPDDKVIFLPPNPADLGYSAWGISATALELVNSNASDLSFEEAPGIVGVVEKDGPPYRQWTYVDAVGMPILQDARKLMVLDTIP